MELMTLDEAIHHAEEVAEENQRVVDTGIVFDDVTIGMLYCDDTEVIEEHLANYQKRASEHRQLAEWLKDYKRLLDREPCEDAISRKDAIWIASGYCHFANISKELEKLPPVLPEQKTGHWIKLPYMAIEADGTILFSYKCSSCKGIGYFRRSEGKIVGGLFCPNCGAKMQRVEDNG